MIWTGLRIGITMRMRKKAEYEEKKVEDDFVEDSIIASIAVVPIRIK